MAVPGCFVLTATWGTANAAATAKSHSYTAGGTDLAAFGYRLDEYFISGKANVYTWGADGTALTPQVRTANAPYTTRMLIRRPTNPAKFSGNVWVELNNPSRGWDVEVEWPTVQEKVLRDGDIWVAITVKPNVIASLKRFDAVRYAPLSMANPLPAAQQACGTLPGDANYDENVSKLFENGLVWDIISQTGALVRSKTSTNPLRNYNVKYVFGTGESQTGFFLNTYAANFAQNAKLSNGKTVYDGLVSVSGAGRFTTINQCEPALEPAWLGVTNMPPTDPRVQLPAKHMPFMRIDAQGDIFTLGAYLTRWSDSNSATAGLRNYEIAGAPHGPSWIVNYQPPAADTAKTAPSSPTPYAYGCVEPKANHLPRNYIESAMFANMERWASKGVRPPRQALFLGVDTTTGSQTTFFGETIKASFAKDAHGNVTGGVRSSYVDVPTATYFEWATAKPNAPYCWSFGHQDDFTSEQLQTIYGSVAPRQTYVADVKASVAKMLASRWLLPADAQQVIRQAELTPIP